MNEFLNAIFVIILNFVKYVSETLINVSSKNSEINILICIKNLNVLSSKLLEENILKLFKIYNFDPEINISIYKDNFLKKTNKMINSYIFEQRKIYINLKIDVITEIFLENLVNYDLIYNEKFLMHIFNNKKR